MRKVRELSQIALVGVLLDRPQPAVHCVLRDIAVDEEGKVFTSDAAPLEESITDADIVADAKALRDKIADRLASRWAGTTIQATKDSSFLAQPAPASLEVVK